MIFISICRSETTPKLLHILLICISCSLVIVPSIALAAQDEAYGIVTNVVDGDTFDVTIEKAGAKVAYSVERIRLADVDSPEMESEKGPAARDFTYAVLKNKRVYLDIDDLSATGRDSYGRLICVAYLSGFYGQPLAAPNFNRLLVDSGHARLENFTNNEFDPQDWRSGPGQVLQAEAEPLQSLGEGLKQNLTQDLLPRLQESAENELDRAAKEGWDWLKGQMGIRVLSGMMMQFTPEQGLDRII
ncbi:MAG: thermonuclease family protein [Methanothrix sp.]|jgi:endonuclease YncB( thermonuclease family)|nr:thermonuclease family protein [Methanothrix sp.]